MSEKLPEGFNESQARALYIIFRYTGPRKESEILASDIYRKLGESSGRKALDSLARSKFLTRRLELSGHRRYYCSLTKEQRKSAEKVLKGYKKVLEE